MNWWHPSTSPGSPDHPAPPVFLPSQSSPSIPPCNNPVQGAQLLALSLNCFIAFFANFHHSLLCAGLPTRPVYVTTPIFWAVYLETMFPWCANLTHCSPQTTPAPQPYLNMSSSSPWNLCVHHCQKACTFPIFGRKNWWNPIQDVWGMQKYLFKEDVSRYPNVSSTVQ